MRCGHRGLVKCSIPGCSSEIFFLKKHIGEEHAPAIFDYYQVECERLARTRVQCLREMAQEVIGESRPLQDMVDLINSRGDIKPGWHITPEQHSSMVGMCKVAVWWVPEEYYQTPINNVAALVHWRCLSVFGAEIPLWRMESLRQRYPASEARRSSGKGAIESTGSISTHRSETASESSSRHSDPTECVPHPGRKDMTKEDPAWCLPHPGILHQNFPVTIQVQQSVSRIWDKPNMIKSRLKGPRKPPFWCLTAIST